MGKFRKTTFDLLDIDRAGGSEQKFVDEYITKPQKGHLAEIGITGSGKTNGLLYIHDLLEDYCPNNTTVVFDTGKSGELLLFAEYSKKPVILHIPEGLDVTIPAGFQVPIEKRYFHPVPSVWNAVEEGCLNIIAITPFFLKPSIKSKVMAQLFDELLFRAHRYELPAPMDIFIDEFQDVCPSRGVNLDHLHYSSGISMAMNLFKLRSLDFSLITAAQAWMDINAAARRSFQWILARLGGYFGRDKPKISRYNGVFEKLPVDKGVLIFPDQWFPGVWNLPYYGNPSEYPRVYYKGLLKEAKDKDDQIKELQAATKQMKAELEAVKARAN